jgi:CYTH domain-containing protein/predicted ATPase
MLIEPITQIPKIPLSGGPGAGKTTSLSRLRDRLSGLGKTPIIVPETATHIFGAGLSPEVLNHEGLLQESIFEHQLSQEKYFSDRAHVLMTKHHKSPVLILDRTLLDIQAYCSKDEWKRLMVSRNVTQSELDQRYPSTIFLEVAPPEFYTVENNVQRRESYDDAVILNEKTKNAYLGTHMYIADNCGTFETKMSHVEAYALHIIGYPEPIEDEVKYTIDPQFKPGDIPKEVQWVKSTITQDYLVRDDPHWVERIRKRVFDDNGIYFTYTQKNRDTKVEKEEIINSYQYALLESTRRDHSKQTVRKNRYTFLYKNQYFELDFFINKPLILLELEKTIIQKEIVLPAWLPILDEVTNDPRYKNEIIAQQ